MSVSYLKQPPAMLAVFLEPFNRFINDNSLTEITVNRPGELWTESSKGWICHDMPELTYDHCRQIATLVASYNGRNESPIISGTLPSGDRIQVVIPPAVEPNTVSITIRKPSVIDFTLDDIDKNGGFALYEKVGLVLKDFEKQLLTLLDQHRIKEFLALAVKHHRNIILAGKTGSGKTTVMKALTKCIPQNERLITIEDVHEVFLKEHKNKVHMFYDRDNTGGITSKQALESCLRMKPDRILLAELRGSESWDYLKAIGSDHSGITTMHAAGAVESFAQLASLIKDSPTGQHLDSDYILRRLHTTIDIVLYYQNRKLMEVYYNPEKKLELLA